uniref:Uncharacterized protein n=1 Tax=Plectus sambesii TaxID=2011161 RepID=A0A914XGY5_9BILA
MHETWIERLRKPEKWWSTRVSLCPPPSALTPAAMVASIRRQAVIELEAASAVVGNGSCGQSSPSGPSSRFRVESRVPPASSPDARTGARAQRASLCHRH